MSAIVDVPPAKREAQDVVVLRGEGLTIPDVIRVARDGAPVRLTDDEALLERVREANACLARLANNGQALYGVTTGFGGMADVRVAGAAEARDLQNNLLWFLKTGAGGYLPLCHVRAAMVVRAGSHLRGASGLRLEVIRRLECFLNEGATPLVREFGSIGASGDLVPLTSIAGALVGADASFRVDLRGEEVDAITALQRLGLPRLVLEAGEGLALVNGTSMMTGIAANCVHDARVLFALALAAHALMIQALGGSNQPFHPFIHRHKPHPGQVWAAARTLALLRGSRMVRDELNGRHGRPAGEPIQDRYSLRCLPQYLGPLVDGLTQVAAQVETEMNSADSNPLIDAEGEMGCHGGNFLGQYVGVGLDHLRYYLGLLAKHLDVQIAALVTPAFNNGLPASLAGNPGRRVNMGLKGLQITGNSLMPLLSFLGNSVVDRFPSHAEQFNQNINSQGFLSATLAWRSVEVFHQYIAVALLFAVQGVELRARVARGHYDPRPDLSPATAHLYETVRGVLGRPPSAERPYVYNDDEQSLDLDLARLAADVASGDLVPRAVAETVASLAALTPRSSENAHEAP